MFAASARLALAAAVIVTPLIAAPTRAASRAGWSSAGPVFFVNALGGHFAQDEPELDLTFDFADDIRVPARIRLYVPAGLHLYPARPAGSDVGSARIYAADATDGSTSSSMLSGDLTASTLNDAVEAAAQSCSPGPHIGLWNLRLSELGRPFDLPIYLAAATSADPPGTGLRIDICPPAVNGGAVLPISQLILQLPELTPPTSKGSYLWRAIVAPLAPDRQSILAQQSYELRAITPVPHRLTLAGIYRPQLRTATLRGTLHAAGRGQPGVRVNIFKLLRLVTPGGTTFRDSLAGSTRTDSSGAYALQTRISGTAGFIAVAAETATACKPPAAAPGGCLNTTIAGTQSDPITISIPKH